MEDLRRIDVLHGKGRGIERRGGGGSSDRAEDGLIVGIVNVLWLHGIREIRRSGRRIIVHGSLMTFKVHVVVIVQGLRSRCCGTISGSRRGIVIGRIERGGHGRRFVRRI